MNFLILILGLLLLLIIAFLLFWKIIFLRNPKRTSPKGKNIVSGADGKVIDVVPFDGKSEVTFFKNNKRYLGIINTLTSDISKKGYIVSVFMSPLNVHYNRSPIDGEVLSVKHTKGKLLPVNSIENGLLNEKSEMIIKGDLKLKVIQIAGLLASRVITYVKQGKKINKGEVFGLINLGSQVTLILPSNVEIKVKKGDKVRAGESVIAVY